MTLDAERHLIQAAQSGNMTAFEKLYLETRDFILRRACFLSGRGQDAEDLAQETYIRALKSISSFRRECRFTTWLYRILWNEVARVHRSARFCFEFELLRDELSQPLPDIDRTIDLHRSLASLGHCERHVVCRDLEGYSDLEIANELELSIAALKSRKHRIRRTIQAALS